MCMGSQPRQPRVEYVQPSGDQLRDTQKALDNYRQETATQQQEFQSQLQDQISQANADTQQLMSDNAAEIAAEQAAASAEAMIDTAYTTSTTQEDVLPEAAQTTKAIATKKKPTKNLKISTAGTANSAGSGVNVGV